MLDQERSPVGGGILANTCGMGKMMMLLIILWYLLVRAANNPMHTYHPTLILCPSALIDT
jgi:hypothetical protein